MNKAIKAFIIIWGCLALMVNVIVITGLFIGVGGFWAGVWRVWDIYNPVHVINWLAELMLISPAICAVYWLEKRKDRERARTTRDAA